MDKVIHLSQSYLLYYQLLKHSHNMRNLHIFSDVCVWWGHIGSRSASSWPLAVCMQVVKWIICKVSHTNYHSKWSWTSPIRSRGPEADRMRMWEKPTKIMQPVFSCQRDTSCCNNLTKLAVTDAGHEAMESWLLSGTNMLSEVLLSNQIAMMPFASS